MKDKFAAIIFYVIFLLSSITLWVGVLYYGIKETGGLGVMAFICGVVFMILFYLLIRDELEEIAKKRKLIR